VLEIEVVGEIVLRSHGLRVVLVDVDTGVGHVDEESVAG
jgi:hypothetical protein